MIQKGKGGNIQEKDDALACEIGCERGKECSGFGHGGARGSERGDSEGGSGDNMGGRVTSIDEGGGESLPVGDSRPEGVVRNARGRECEARASEETVRVGSDS